MESANDATWDSVDPFDASDPHYWVRLEHLGRYLFAADYLVSQGCKTVLELGCGKGYGTELLAQAGMNVVAVDADESAVEQTRRRCRDMAVTVEHLDLNHVSRSVEHDVRHDAVVAFETLEHLLDPASAVRWSVQGLGAAGRFVCSVPCRVWESVSNDGLPANRGHRLLFGRQNLVRLIEDAGLVVEYILGQGLPNYLMRRERQLLKRRKQAFPLGEVSALNAPELVSLLSRLLAYPSVEYAEWSYSYVATAHLNEPR